MMRAIAEGMDPAIVRAVDARLDGVITAHDVRIPWAIESGSRAWGFPSPDSDYDCRFVFVRPAAQYLSLWAPRDVIETPLDEIFDVNGWDLAKAVKLVVKGNATPVEWLRSPVVYRGDAGFRTRLLSLADEVVDRDALRRHYRHVSELNLARGGGHLKKFFYALRPAAAVRWLDVHPSAALPPMDLPTLLAEGDVPAEIRELAGELIALKAVTREMGEADVPAALRSFVTTVIATGDLAPAHDDVITERRERADEWFRAEVTRAE